MKTMKRIAALMLALCMLIALPMAVGAEDTTPLTIKSVAPNSWSDANSETTKIKFTFSENVNSGKDTANDLSGVFAAVGIYADANSEGQYRYTWDDATGTCTKATRTDHSGQTGTTQWALSNFHRRSQGANQLLGTLPSGWTINKIIAIYEKVLESYPNARLVGKLSDKTGAEDGYVDGIFASADSTKKLSTIDCTSGLDWSECTIVNAVKSVSAYENGLVLEFTRTLPQSNMGLTTTLGLYKDGVALADGSTWTVNMAKAQFYGSGQKAIYVPFDQIDEVKTALAANAGYSVGILMASTQTNENAGMANIITGVAGDTFSCNAMAGDKKAIYRKVTVVDEAKLSLLDAKLLGDNAILLTFNQPVAWTTKHWAGLTLYKSKTDSSAMAYKMNEDQTDYVYDKVGTIGAANVNGNGVTAWKRAQWDASKIEVVGQAGNQIRLYLNGNVTNESVMAICKTGMESGLDLRFRVQENANQGETKNGMVDTIWAADNEKNKLIGSKEDGQTQTWISISEHIKGVAMVGATGYGSLDEALAAAKANGGTVMMLNDVTAEMVKVPAGVTLDLCGKALTTDILVAFGDVIDSTEGSGKLVASQDGAESIIHLQENNSAMPLYDADGYRFFGYTEGKLDAKVAEDGSSIKFGIQFKFKNAKAYELLAAEQNAKQVTVKLVAVKAGKTSEFTYYISSSTLASYAEKVDTMTNPAVTLTVSGIGELESIAGTPAYVSPIGMVYTGVTGSYAVEAE